MENRTVAIIIVLGILVLYLYGGYNITEGPEEIPCTPYSECEKIAQEKGIERSTIICEMVEGVDKCKVIVS